MIKIKLNADGSLTIPKEVLERLGVGSGDSVTIDEREARILVEELLD